MILKFNFRNVQVSILYPGLIDTGMFLGVEHRFPHLTPPLNPKHVSNKIISILDSGRGQELKLPFYANFVALLRMMPLELADFLREVRRVLFIKVSRGKQ